ncbi:g1886 [Coccomyxa elongata]
MAGEDMKSYIVQGFQDNLREDGRSCREFRPITLSVSGLQQCSGSARCSIGSTQVLVGVKVEIGVPLEQTPDCGGLQVTVECSPCAGPSYAGRAGEELGAELTKSLERYLKPGSSGRGGSLDLRALSIVSGRRCWILCIDALVLAVDGNVLDALSIAVKAALQDTRIPLVEVGVTESPDEEPELELDDDPAHAKQIDTSQLPVIMTVSQAGRAYILDASCQEETCMESAIQLAVNSSGALCGLFKRGPSAVNPAVLQEMMAFGQRQGPILIRAADSFIKSATNVMQY